MEEKPIRHIKIEVS